MDVSAANNWGAGFVVNVTVIAMQTINGWVYEFTFDGDITSIWNAQIISQAGNTYTVQAMGYNANLTAGASASFGFVGLGAFDSIAPISINDEIFGGDAGLSNLALDEISIDDVSFDHDQTGTIVATVTSNGAADADASTLSLVVATFPDFNAVTDVLETQALTALATGTQQNVSFDLEAADLDPGTYWVAVVADPAGALEEENEADNLTQWIEVTVSAPPVFTEGDDVWNGDAIGTVGDMLAGDDIAIAVAGANDQIDGGAGIDTLDLSGFDQGVSALPDGTSVVVGAAGADSFDSVWTNFESVIGSSAADVLMFADTTVRDIDAGGGDDLVLGSSGNDTIDAGSGNDQISGWAGDDVITTGTGQDVIFLVEADEGHDTVTDFDVTMDLLYLNTQGDLGYDPFDAMVQTADGVLLTQSNTASVLLSGVSLDDLSADNFILDPYYGDIMAG
ncbi:MULTISPECIES: cellulose binding domain-containing protein [Rhodobacterales]|uniref:cellulose binding domain-containing protein n=1 Tax=Rhodobacterales TaxID=204455 RepID=UPI00215D9516|nr:MULTISPECIES: cellulose binding domain-containing protein [Rhodobacterales]MDO6589092.1 cellulose binding domain-containing protein [Yoonia sp. 1_MG-2023]